MKKNPLFRSLRVFFFLFMGIFSGRGSVLAEQAEYKLYCLVTPQYRPLLENFFLPSIQDDFLVVTKEYPEECLSGCFRSEGWDLVMLYKLDLLLEAIQENWNQIFFYSDVDVIFLKPLLQTALSMLGENDFVAQQSWPTDALCAGFFIMRGNERTLALVRRAYDSLREKRFVDDQLALQAALKDFSNGLISWSVLPSDQFSNGRKVMVEKRGHYFPGAQIVLDNRIALFHATSCIGLRNKQHFLQHVRDLYEKR